MSTDKRIVKVDNWIYYEIWTDDEPSIIQIKRQQAHYNDTEGALYAIGFPDDDRTIGRWWNVNVEAEKWKEMSRILYENLKYGYSLEALEEDLKQYEKLIEDEKSK